MSVDELSRCFSHVKEIMKPCCWFDESVSVPPCVDYSLQLLTVTSIKHLSGCLPVLQSRHRLFLTVSSSAILRCSFWCFVPQHVGWLMNVFLLKRCSLSPAHYQLHLHISHDTERRCSINRERLMSRRTVFNLNDWLLPCIRKCYIKLYNNYLL